MIRCIACSSMVNLTKHHVVPYCYRGPIKYVTAPSNLISICRECHDAYELSANKRKNKYVNAAGTYYDFHVTKHQQVARQVVALNIVQNFILEWQIHFRNWISQRQWDLQLRDKVCRS